MLINVRISELLSNTNKSIPLAIFIIISFIYTFYPMIPDNYISLLEKFPTEGSPGSPGSPGSQGSLGSQGSEGWSSLSESERGGPSFAAPPFYKARQAEDIFNNFFSIIHLISLISSQRDNVFYVTGKS